ncbi:dATP/dGTP diphosphohydrolase domain-containing protein [Poseidonocella sp. HB161398]|uniref:dATP/dGTP diphosphohydrolase domain-containing protein n=1 Tax=Poseidonocella sp. HB161398 TaxID=2320855 RepID=UPI001109D8EF|nr:dATP/dGTP diphosphohydrolase domain-containing protein [Poseidonocella sp. HB161398]
MKTPDADFLPLTPSAPRGFDPKQGAGAAKVPMAVVPWAVVLEMAAAMGEGGIKYGPHNWRASGGVCASTYLAACFRHLIAFAMGEDLDPDTLAEDGGGGVSHLAKMMASAAVLRDAMLHGTATDDRPAASPPDIIREITAAYCGLIPRAEAARAKLKDPTQ